MVFVWNSHSRSAESQSSTKFFVQRFAVPIEYAKQILVTSKTSWKAWLNDNGSLLMPKVQQMDYCMKHTAQIQQSWCVQKTLKTNLDHLYPEIAYKKAIPVTLIEVSLGGLYWTSPQCPHSSRCIANSVSKCCSDLRTSISRVGVLIQDNCSQDSTQQTAGSTIFNFHIIYTIQLRLMSSRSSTNVKTSLPNTCQSLPVLCDSVQSIKNDEQPSIQLVAFLYSFLTCSGSLQNVHVIAVMPSYTNLYKMMLARHLHTIP